MGLAVRKRAFCICKNKGADQLRGYICENKEADQLHGNPKLISTFVFATQIIQSLYFLNL